MTPSRNDNKGEGGETREVYRLSDKRSHVRGGLYSSLSVLE